MTTRQPMDTESTSRWRVHGWNVCLAALLVCLGGCDALTSSSSPRNAPQTHEVTLEGTQFQFFHYEAADASGEGFDVDKIGIKKRLRETIDDVPAAHRRAVAVWSPGMPQLPQDEVYVADLTDVSSGDTVTVERRNDTWLRDRHLTIDQAEWFAESRRSHIARRLRRAKANPFLWRVQSEKGRDVYLFGTIHTEPLDDEMGLVPQVREAFEASTRFAMESDLSNLKDISKSQIFLLKGEQLNEMLGEEAWSTLTDKIGDTVPPARLKKMRPWVAGSMLTREIADFGTSMDRDFLERSEKAGKEITFLESTDKGLEAVKAMFDIEALKKSLTHLDKVKEQYDALSNAYRKGDAESLGGVMAPGDGPIDPDPKEIETVFTERNKLWMSKIESYLESSKGPTFVAVGAGHLVGPDHLIGMLEDKGYEVERLN